MENKEMADFNYPEKYEIEEVCRNFVKRRFLNQFMQERGIFAVNASNDDISAILSNCILDSNAIEDIRMNAFQESNKNSLSGLQLLLHRQTFRLRTFMSVLGIMIRFL